MCKRCEESGGRFTLTTDTGQGTRISCLFPVTTISN
jgi:signal transduction histidine kinase